MLLLALAAGVLAAVNPCGFALLPAYLSLLVLDEGEPRRRAVGRALLSTLGLTTGFVGVFGLVGAALTPALGWLPQRLPWFTIGFGLLLAVLGGWLAAGHRLPALPWRPSRAPALTRSLPSMVLFGAAYALASLSCTIGPFLAIVGSSLQASSAWDGIGLFVAYAAGMGLVVGAAAVAVALVRTSLLARVRRSGPLIARAAGVLMLLTGAYVAYYGWYEVRLAADGPRALQDPVIRAAAGVQERLAHGLDSAGVSVITAAFLVLLLAAVVLGRRAARRP
ncbi:cytochrome c biogenesis CcdA family protein [Dactylosporangium matsuzakiense]|uniref:Cytochrome C biogenesis protein CcdA n=1 Tax=Dactylosporangium matsuzakiense TaxID=53360 RepID=A0A9W6NRF0_9ACTN|nr:cytochrome c biogenesis CcdA family protein [Dactylosporangium matsuzakiense]UWZ47721.1 cytochrome c biogenesis protein CcdA [Dactylosporangium matsuzakiense]GLL06102.1 cytochrome C biogenesis protein CcdA [Dactylosporangium matsuzakiense]